MKFLSTVLLLGLLLGISVAIIPRRDQSCADNVYESWYFNGQQCMQCYNYDATDGDNLCFNCNTDGTCSGDCAGGYSSASETVYYDLEGKKLMKSEADNLAADEYVEADVQYCRRCDTNKGYQGLNCCFMDQKQRFQDTDEFKRSNDNGIHITQCLSTGDMYLKSNGDKVKFNEKGVMTRYGSMCQYIKNCAEVGNYGHCRKCMPGYYLDSSLECVGCSNKVWDDLNKDSFDIEVDQFQQMISANASKNACEICEGKNTCRKCMPGYYLASNYLREHFDRNIAKHASYCLPCAAGCLCEESSNLCTGCKESEGWYYNPKTLQCEQCTKYVGEGDKKRLDREDMRECNKCEWVDEIEDVICIECNARSSDDVSNIIDLFVPYTYKDSNGDYQIIKEKKKICMTCQEAMKAAKKINVNLKRKADKADQFEITDDVDSIKLENIDNRKFDGLLFISAFADEQNSITEGCSNCQKLQANAKETKGGADTGNSQEIIYFLTCSTCNNGYAEHTIPGGYYVEAKISDQVRYWQMKEVTTCQRCQKLIEQYDKDVSYQATKDEDQTVETKFQDYNGNRQQLVRRCKRVQDTQFYNQYEITQCGSYDDDNNYLQTSNEDFSDKGLAYFKDYANKEKEGGYNAKILATKAPVTDYFSKEKKLGYFKVDIKSDSDEYNAQIKNLCVENKNSCMKILDLSTLSGSYDDAQVESSPRDDPRCESCFPGYIKTVSNICKECKEEVNGLPSGCIKCEQDTDENAQDDIKCVKCRNNVQCKSQGKNDGSAGSTEARSNAYTLLNYFYSEKQCIACNEGCLTCEGANRECTKAQDFWRIVPGTTPPTFEQCTKDFCIRCDDNKDVCEQCQEGYVKIQFKKTEVEGGTEKTIILCEKCGEGCTACDSDSKSAPFNRTICTDCAEGYYLTSEGKCSPKRANCIYWNAKGGECLQCAQGYRLTQGWCYSCLDYAGGFKDCPSSCDSETKMHSNVRTASQIKVDEELFKKKYPSEPTERILELLDESM